MKKYSYWRLWALLLKVKSYQGFFLLWMLLFPWNLIEIIRYFLWHLRTSSSRSISGKNKLASLSLNFSTNKHQKLQLTSELYALMRRVSATKNHIFIASSPTSWHKEGISPITMAPEASQSTGGLSLTKTSKSSMMSPGCSPWQMQDLIRMGPNSSSPLFLVLGSMENIQFLVKLWMGRIFWKNCMLWVQILAPQDQRQP